MVFARMLADGLIEPAFHARSASPAYAVPKSGATRHTLVERAFPIVVDY
jgi:hypothetical protein